MDSTIAGSVKAGYQKKINSVIQPEKRNRTSSLWLPSYSWKWH